MSKFYGRKSKKARTSHNIVLDLDETLISTCLTWKDLSKLKIFSDPRMLQVRGRLYNFEIEDVEDKKGSGNDLELAGIARPHYDKFISFCFEHFDKVIVWSAGTYSYVHKVVEFLFRDAVRKPDAILTRNDCQMKFASDGTLDYTEKPLKLIAEKHAHLSNCMIHNTFILDNTETAFSGVNPLNGILIPNYELKKSDVTMEKLLAEDDLELALPLLQNWLMDSAVMNCKDIRTLPKNKIFGTFADQ